MTDLPPAVKGGSDHPPISDGTDAVTVVTPEAAPAASAVAPSGWTFCLEQLKLFLPVFREGADILVTEMRVLGIPSRGDYPPGKRVGYFELTAQAGRTAFATAIKSYVEKPPEEQPEGIYLVIGAVDPALLACSKNKLGFTSKVASCTDANIVARRWILVDADPKKAVKGASATDAEKAAARHVIDGVREDLRQQGFADPMLCDSGNGFHAWYRASLPVDDGGYVKDLLHRLARRHNTKAATVDTTVYNASQLVKVPGSFARKGSSTDERPHRQSRILDLPRGGN
jgi:hypothetical protein